MPRTECCPSRRDPPARCRRVTFQRSTTNQLEEMNMVMVIPKTITNFNGLSDQDLVTLGGSVAARMKGNKSFTNPPADPDAVQTAVDELVAALAAQVDGGPSATAAKNNKRRVLIALLRKLSAY